MAPAHGPQDQRAIRGTTNDQDAAAGGGGSKLFDQFECFVGVGIQRNDADVGMSLSYDVREKLVARALGLEPDHLQAQQHAFQRITRRIAGIDDR